MNFSHELHHSPLLDVILGAVELGDKGMGHAFFGSESFRRFHLEQALEQVHSGAIDLTWSQFRVEKFVNITSEMRNANESLNLDAQIDCVLPKKGVNSILLVHGVLAWKQGPTQQHFTKNAA